MMEIWFQCKIFHEAEDVGHIKSFAPFGCNIILAGLEGQQKTKKSQMTMHWKCQDEALGDLFKDCWKY